MEGDNLQPGAWPLDELYATYIHDPEGHLLMPHVGGRRCNMDWHHPVLERLVEIESAWGHFPWLYEDVMRKGYKLGASANGDEHRGRCGGGVPGTAVFGTKGGVTGIIADTLDRKEIGVALRARHTWATTGERLVGLTSCGSNMQGDEFDHKGAAKIDYRFMGDLGWDEIAAFDHTGCIWKRNLQKEKVSLIEKYASAGVALESKIVIGGLTGKAKSPYLMASLATLEDMVLNTRKKLAGAAVAPASSFAPTPMAMPMR
jgi:hypothetical protein